MLNISVVCLDPERDGMFIPYAKAQVRAFAAEWRGFYMSRTIVVEETTILMEVWAEEQARVSLFPALPYMESGVLDIFGAGELAETTYRPAVVRFTPRVGRLSGKRLPNAVGHKLKDGDETWTKAGCKPSDKSKSVVAEALLSSREFTRDTPTYCPTTPILQRKKMLQAVPASIYSGKLKLFVQALYGSLRDDFKVEMNGAMAELSLKTDQMSEPPPGSTEKPVPIYTKLRWGYPTTGLITTPNGEYLLATVTTGGVNYYRMAPKQGRNAKRSEEAEAYTLAQLRPVGKLKLATGRGLPTGYKQPLAYGWHFSKSGMEAHVSLYNEKKIYGKISTTDNQGSITGYTFTLMRIEFSWNSETKELSYVASEVGSGDHVPYLHSKMFTPMQGVVGMKLFLPGGDGPWEDIQLNASAPVYCYYDNQDRLQTVNAINSAYAKTPERWEPKQFRGVLPSSLASRGVYVFDHAYCQPTEYAKFTYEPETSIMRGFGFTGTMGNQTGDNKIAVGTSTTDIMYLDGNGPRTDYSETLVDINFIPYARTEYYSLLYNNSDRSYRLATLATDKSTDCTPVLVIPYDDCSAVIMGIRNTESAKSTTRQYYTFGNNVTYYWPPSKNIPSNKVPGFDLWDQAGDVVWSLQSTLATEAQYSGANKEKIFVGNSRTILNAYVAGEIIKLYEYYADDWQNVGGYVYRGDYGGLFECSATDVYYARRMTIRSSYFGAVRHDNCLPSDVVPNTGYAGGWPEEKVFPGSEGPSAPIGFA